MEERVLSGRYKLQELIGGGGMADVYKAWDLLLDRPVAVKILHDQFKRDSEFITKFHREAKAAAKLMHPSIVNIYDVGVMGNDHYIVMEYVPGNTLKMRIQREGKIPVLDALQIAKEIADGLAHAHAHNIVHCDVKPHNILLMADGHSKVADFGIARAVTESTMTYSGNIIGSVHYFSPEQAKGTMITPKSDVYSLGVLLYEMLTGELPFMGETPVSIAVKHIQEMPIPIRQYVADIPPIVETLVGEAMNKDAAMRPDSADFSRKLEEAAQMIRSGMIQRTPDSYATQVLPRVESNIPQYTNTVAPTEPREERSSFRSKTLVFALLSILFVGFMAGSFLFFGKFWSATEVTVPDVTGKQLVLARQLLEDKKLRVNVAETYDADVPVGQVVSQSPEAGSVVKEERTITIYISKGGEELEMPDLKGLSRADAETKLTRMGLKLGSVYDKFSNDDDGTILAQEPRAGGKVRKGETVDLTISKGPKTKKVNVPNVKGDTLDSAKSALSKRGLSVGEVKKVASREPEGTVISQSVDAGDEVDEGTSISLEVSEHAQVQKDDTKADKGTKVPAKKIDAGEGKTKN